VSTTVIAQRLGISQGALFKRFGTKKELLKAALVPQLDAPWYELALAGPTDAPILEQLHLLGRDMGAFFETVIPQVSLLRSCGFKPEDMFSNPDDVPFSRVHKALTGWFAAASRSGQVRECDPSAVAFTLMGALHVRVFANHIAGSLAPSEPMEKYVGEVIRLLWSGLAPSEAT
jgi:AcrR family transcriptional regulator